MTTASRVSSARTSPRSQRGVGSLPSRRKMGHGEREGQQQQQRPMANGHSPTTGLSPSLHANVVHINGYRLNPAVAAVLGHFSEVRYELHHAESQENKAAIITKFLDTLPPSLGQAARHHVMRQLSHGVSVNIDDLVNYLAKLEMASALATPRQSPTPNNSKSLKLSPSKRHMPPISAERESSDYIDFAPSRPNVSNLLLDDDAKAIRANGDMSPTQ
ncbi:uncharacterized protein CcaverHIS019_0101280 [Cutaneotrichosporon cavernicola]|uniref:Uncharacterized protein n=1 Tax=Cutaneotrichosporon cavernicola TaxID=279322 RepID=A0AA48KZW1_9TREE|nr:uncharacterized protein CcaverHIS019_0101280 [Cutaneotrichosporon cavernicola]BEI87410.1 hypothetical protein CcaverHIS019_0101280 [Cutaneotrichosporon cavernicola]BEI95178.1 hypothetical protein CcaverHIS631_0101270 [Cutaneotrichosporon cavernicola]